MENLSESMTIFGYKPFAVVVAIAGSALSLQFAKTLTWKQGIVTATTGALIAVIAVPAFTEWQNMSSGQNVENALSFFTALFGMAIASAIFKAIDNIDIGGIINARIKKLLGAK